MNQIAPSWLFTMLIIVAICGAVLGAIVLAALFVTEWRARKLW